MLALLPILVLVAGGITLYAGLKQPGVLWVAVLLTVIVLFILTYSGGRVL